MPGQAKSLQLGFYKSFFTAEFLDGVILSGWTDGSDWNGWATPCFEFAEAQRLIQLHQAVNGPESAYYDPQSDTFGFLLNGEDEPELYRAGEIEADGQTVKVYPIGSYSWVWEEAAPEGTDTASLVSTGH